MALWDITWEMQGEQQVTEDLLLLNPTFKVKRINYDAETRHFQVEVIFQEGSYKHSRTFDNTLAEGDESIDAVLIAQFINTQFPTAQIQK
ncbi:MAG: hypothetical protein MK081_13935 [Flavobacteriales bacterium]|nr:hypothetical protein [Flavobacteriales bacterium]